MKKVTLDCCKETLCEFDVKLEQTPPEFTETDNIIPMTDDKAMDGEFRQTDRSHGQSGEALEL